MLEQVPSRASVCMDQAVPEAFMGDLPLNQIDSKGNVLSMMEKMDVDDDSITFTNVAEQSLIPFEGE